MSRFAAKAAANLLVGLVDLATTIHLVSGHQPDAAALATPDWSGSCRDFWTVNDGLSLGEVEEIRLALGTSGCARIGGGAQSAFTIYTDAGLADARAEPTPPDMTPWGAPEVSTRHAAGIWFISTPSHGGFWLSPERIRAVGEDFLAQTWNGQQGRLGWFEEDSDANFVVASFPEVFGQEDVQHAVQMIDRRAQSKLLVRGAR